MLRAGTGDIPTGDYSSYDILYVQEVVTPQKKYSNIFATVFLLLRYFRLNIIRLQSKIILGHVNYIE